jgi:hypothetical protein
MNNASWTAKLIPTSNSNWPANRTSAPGAEPRAVYFVWLVADADVVAYVVPDRGESRHRGKGAATVVTFAEGSKADVLLGQPKRCCPY